MRAQILLTFITRFGGAVAGFAIAIVLSQFLGADGKGEASLLILNISFINLLTNVMGGAALVFLAPRFHTFTLLAVSWVWVLASALLLWVLYLVLGIELTGLHGHTFTLAVLLGLFNTNTNILLGKKKTTEFNILTVAQVLLTLGYLLFAFFGGILPVHFHQYIYALYVGYGLTFAASLYYVLKETEGYVLTDVKEVLRRFIKHGGYIQLANLGQLLIYRAAFYIIEYSYGLTELGIYSNAVAIAESIWIVSRSISTIQYSEVANEADIDVSRRKTILLRKTNVAIAAGLAIVVCLLPDGFYTMLFGKDFTGLQQIIWFLAPGIVAFAYAIITTHFFSGIGKNHYNTIISFAGFGVTIITGLIVIPIYGSVGAAITASVVNIACAVLAEGMFSKKLKA